MDKLRELQSKHYNKTPIGGPLDGLGGEKSGSNTASPGEILIFAITQCLKYLILFAGIALVLIMLPILPFLWVSYKGFHGKYGIIKLFRENYNVYQL